MSQTIQTPNVGKLLTELFRLTGSVRPELEEMVLPTVMVADLSGSSPAVQRRHAMSEIAHVAGVGNNARFELRSPINAVGINTIGIVTDLYVRATAADELFVGFGATTLPVTPPAGKRFFDGRLGAADITPVFDFVSADVAAGLTRFGRHNVPTTASLEELHLRPHGWVVTQDNALILQNNVAAGTMLITIEWDEYQLP